MEGLVADQLGDATAWEPTDATPSVSEAPSTGPRYQDLGRLGAGATADVRRVRDTRLERGLAMKVLRAEHLQDAAACARFARERRVPALLAHPGIVSVFDHGVLPDGRPWFTMQQVHGRGLRAVIDDLNRFRGLPSWDLALREVVESFTRIVEAMAYAHTQGVLHRDLKPENLMVGDFGEVLILDWGLARLPDGAPRRADRSMGSPQYRPPEQALGSAATHTAASDVYALGVMLHELLTGTRPPRAERRSDPVRVDPSEGAGPLSEVCERALQLDPQERHPDGTALANALRGWLRGTRSREQSLEALAVARDLQPRIHQLRDKALEHRTAAEQLLEGLRTYDPPSQRHAAWALQDEASRLETDAEVAEATWLQTVRSAVALDPTLGTPHELLADHYRERLTAAEHRPGRPRAAAFESHLRAHDRGQHASFLAGLGHLSLVTDPPGAQVTAHRVVARHRRLEPDDQGQSLGTTPLDRVPLRQGGWVLRLVAQGCHPVTLPVRLWRGEAWPPGPVPTVLPPVGSIAPDEVVVPAGWAWCGGDPQAPDSLPGRQLWIDAFVMARHPVTTGEYLRFLNHLLATGREEEAWQHAPADKTQSEGKHQPLVRCVDGRFDKVIDLGGAPWRDDWPVALIDWHGATAYAAWRANLNGQPWRLPNELEWEKAARGADGRTWPWGNHFEPAWTHASGSTADVPQRVPIGTMPHDVSPYGVQGMAGNVRDWCANPWTEAGPDVVDQRLVLGLPPRADNAHHAIRGGSFGSTAHLCRAATRFGSPPTARFRSLGFRLVRALPIPAP